MNRVVTLVVSPRRCEKTSTLLKYVNGLLRRRGFNTESIAVDTFPVDDLLCGRSESQAIQAAVFALDDASGIIIASPICKDSYTAMLEAFLHMLPRGAFTTKSILPLALTRNSSSVSEFDSSFSSDLAALNAGHVSPTVCIAESQIQFEHGGILRLEEAADQHLKESLADLVGRIR